MRSTYRGGIAALVIAIAAAPAAAQAAWLTAGSGTGRAQATTVERGNAPAAVRDAGKVDLQWDASTLASGQPVAGYDVIRHVAGGADTTVCSHVTTTSCTDGSPVPGTVSYGVVPRVGTYWTGPESPLTTFTFNTDPPGVPTGLRISDDTGASSTDGVTKTALQTISGAAAPGSTVTLYRATTQVGTATAGSNGTWSIGTVTLSEGANTFTATATDAYGKTSASSAPLNATLDTVAPAAPTLTPALSADTGTNPSDRITRTPAQTVTGTAEAGSSVTVTGAQGTTTATAGGTFSLAITLQEGPNSLVATATDLAGNVSPASTSVKAVLDTAAPVVTNVQPTEGAKITASGWTNKGPCGSGRICVDVSDPGSGVSSVQYALSQATPTATACYNGGNFTGGPCPATPMTAPSSGATWSDAITGKDKMTPATYTLTVTASDVAGNTSSFGPTTFTVTNN